MSDLKTSYLGLELKNPIIVSSSGLTSTIEKVRKCAEAGAGAVVLKSLFEEQIDQDKGTMMQDMDPSMHADAYDFYNQVSENYYLDEYIGLVEESKKQTDIPIIASLNCISAGQWFDFAKKLETAGADALELNVFIMPADARKTSVQVESIYLDIIRKIKKQISIPVSLKIGPHFSGMAHVIKEFDSAEIDGLVLFNRFYRPDVNIESIELKPASFFSSATEMTLSLQWIALMSGETNCDFSAATGIHDGQSIIKQLLVGASSVQLCTVLYKEGLSAIKPMLSEIEAWMERKGFGSIADFKGKLCQEASEHPETYERSQYIKALVGIA